MERIIAGRFFTKGDADAAATAMAPYVERADICIFHNNPPGQHDAFAVGGDEDIERADGEWRDGDWADFNPVATPRLVESLSH